MLSQVFDTVGGILPFTLFHYRAIMLITAFCLLFRPIFQYDTALDTFITGVTHGPCQAITRFEVSRCDIVSSSFINFAK